MYKIQVSEEAEVNLKSIPKRDQARILKRIANYSTLAALHTPRKFFQSKRRTKVYSLTGICFMAVD